MKTVPGGCLTIDAKQNNRRRSPSGQDGRRQPRPPPVLSQKGFTVIEFSASTAGPGRYAFRSKLPQLMRRLAELPRGSCVDGAGRCLRFGSSPSTPIPLELRMTEAELLEHRLVEKRAQLAMLKARLIMAKTKRG